MRRREFVKLIAAAMITPLIPFSGGNHYGVVTVGGKAVAVVTSWSLSVGGEEIAGSFYGNQA